MDGYCVPDPYFTSNLEELVQTLVKVLRDPALPLLEMQVRLLIQMFSSFPQLCCGFRNSSLALGMNIHG